jgi:hypothetical protein
MADTHHEHDQPVVLDLVYDTVLAHANSVQVVQTGELLDAFGARVRGQGVHRPDEAKLIPARELEKFPAGGGT